jgi:Fic family protein
MYFSDIIDFMHETEADRKADTEEVLDRGEHTFLMEPLTISQSSRQRTALTDLALELTQRATAFRKSLPDGVMTALADLVRSMNCYYSNLIEGHDTHPIDIERALKNDYSADPAKRILQLEAKAHITVQRWIDEGGSNGRAFTVDGIRELHQRFCEQLPDEMLWVTFESTGEQVRVVPGAYRTRYVQVGKHIPVSPGAVPRFMERFEQGYTKLGRTDTILASASAHHRLAWIHPFTDGNGRVIRLMSYAVLRETLDTGGVWSIARGLARNVEEYKRHLAACDQPRRNDLDGRGNLSEEALAGFVNFFLRTCIDQVAFMEDLVQPERLRTRMLLWAEEEIKLDNLPARAGNVLEAILYRGAVPRGDVPEIVGTGPRQARRIVSALIEKGVVTSPSSRAPLRLSLPATLASRFTPGLFPEK